MWFFQVTSQKHRKLIYMLCQICPEADVLALNRSLFEAHSRVLAAIFLQSQHLFPAFLGSELWHLSLSMLCQRCSNVDMLTFNSMCLIVPTVFSVQCYLPPLHIYYLRVGNNTRTVLQWKYSNAIVLTLGRQLNVWQNFLKVQSFELGGINKVFWPAQQILAVKRGGEYKEICLILQMRALGIFWQKILWFFYNSIKTKYSNLL